MNSRSQSTRFLRDDVEINGLVCSFAERESRPGESHPEPLAEPYVKLSPHTAPIAQTIITRTS